MAEIVGTVVLGVSVNFVLEKALALAKATVHLIHGFNKDLEKLRQYVEMIHAVLDDAEKKKQSQDDAVTLWLERLEKVAYEAYEVFDEYHETLGLKERHCFKGNVYSLFFFPQDCHRFYFRCRMAPKFQDIIIKLEDINKQANEFALQYRMSEPHFSTAGTSVNNNHETDSFVAPYVVVRPDDDDDWIVL